MNGASECVERYKRSVIRAAIRRAQKTCSTPQLFESEIDKCKQIMINNGYSNEQFDTELGRLTRPPPVDTEVARGTTHKVYYRNQMTDGHRVDERVLGDLVAAGVTCTNENDKVVLVIYYKNKKTSNIIMKNNLQKYTTLQCTRVIYEYTCQHEDCKPHKSKYIGHTLTTLSRRLTMHKQSGAIQKHSTSHGETLQREELVENTIILKHYNDSNRLQIGESLLLKKIRPSINKQDTGFVRKLHLFSNHVPTSNHDNTAPTPSAITSPPPPAIAATQGGPPQRRVQPRRGRSAGFPSLA